MSSAKTGRRGPGLPVWLGMLVFLVIAAWSAYWFIAAGEIRKGVDGWISEQRQAGNSVEFTKLDVTGYPFRFVIEMKDPVYAAPSTGWRWQGEKLQLVVQSWNLYHVIALAPGTSHIRFPDGQEIELTPAHHSAASLKFDSDRHLKEFRLSVPAMDTRENGKHLFSLTDLTIGLRPMPDVATTLQLSISVTEAQLSDLPPDIAWLGPDVDETVIWIEVENFYPLVEGLLDYTGWRVDGNQVHLRRGETNWGPLDVATRASIKLDRDNQPNGTVGVHLENTEELLAALDRAGLLDKEKNTAIATLGLMSRNNNFATVQLKDRGIYLLGNKLGEY